MLVVEQLVAGSRSMQRSTPNGPNGELPVGSVRIHNQYVSRVEDNASSLKVEDSLSAETETEDFIILEEDEGNVNGVAASSPSSRLEQGATFDWSLEEDDKESLYLTC